MLRVPVNPNIISGTYSLVLDFLATAAGWYFARKANHSLDKIQVYVKKKNKLLTAPHLPILGVAWRGWDPLRVLLTVAPPLAGALFLIAGYSISGVNVRHGETAADHIWNNTLSVQDTSWLHDSYSAQGHRVVMSFRSQAGLRAASCNRIERSSKITYSAMGTHMTGAGFRDEFSVLSRSDSCLYPEVSVGDYEVRRAMKPFMEIMKCKALEEAYLNLEEPQVKQWFGKDVIYAKLQRDCTGQELEYIVCIESECVMATIRPAKLQISRYRGVNITGQTITGDREEAMNLFDTDVNSDNIRKVLYASVTIAWGPFSMTTAEWAAVAFTREVSKAAVDFTHEAVATEIGAVGIGLTAAGTFAVLLVCIVWIVSAIRARRFSAKFMPDSMADVAAGAMREIEGDKVSIESPKVGLQDVYFGIHLDDARVGLTRHPVGGDSRPDDLEGSDRYLTQWARTQNRNWY